MSLSQVKSASSTLVLVVDDHPDVRRLAQRILTDAGYVVHSVASGSEALSWLDSNAHGVHVVLSDFAMPEMNGFELLDRVLGQWPQVRTVLMSGSADDQIARAARQHASTPFIAKPFGREQLVNTIEAVLTRPTS